MNKTIYLLVLLLSVVGKTMRGQGFERSPHVIRATIGESTVEVTFYSPSIVRVTRYVAEHLIEAPSLSVIKKPGAFPLHEHSDSKEISINSDSLLVKVDKRTGQVRFCTPGGHHLLAEKEAGFQCTPITGCTNPAYMVSQAFTVKPDEAIYGLGQHQDGIMNYRDHSVTLSQENKQVGIPFIQSINGYGLFWDNYSDTRFKDSAGEVSFSSEIAGREDYYFIYGGTADGVLAGFRSLTGTAPLMPRWTLGYWQSRERYTSQYQLVNTVRKYRELGVPLDGIVQDWQYWSTDDAYWNSTLFGNPQFPQPGKMIDSVHAMHAHIMISVWPSFGKQTDIYKEMKAKGLLFGFKTWPETASVYNPFDSLARAIYWSYLQKNLFNLGIDAWWMDASEPELDRKDSIYKSEHCMGSFRSLHNAFPLATTGGVYLHQREQTSAKRVFILTRSAFAGQQRNSTAVWSGDIESSWKVLHDQISGGLNLSLCGIPYWNTDIGGFYPGGNFPNGTEDPTYKELYVRWLQFGAFTPIFRSHGTSTPREIWQFGQKGDTAYDAIATFIGLRYRLLPYIYATAWTVTSRGTTIMRPLMMDFPLDSKACDLNDEYLFGKAILVAPITTPEHARTVYLPKGAAWIDFWTGQQLQGGEDIKKETPLDIMPLYVKAGSILPMGPSIQYTSKNDGDPLEIRVYEGANGKFLLYEDEYDNYDYEKGQHATTLIQWNDQEKTLTIAARKGAYPGMSLSRKFTIVLVRPAHGTGQALTPKADRVIVYDGRAVTLRF